MRGSAVAANPSCRDHARLLDAYLDGVLEPSQMLEIENHVTECGRCRERVELDRATRGSLKRVVKEVKPVVPDAFRARMMAAMQAEAERGGPRERTLRTPPAGWKTMVPLASAAAFALAWGVHTRAHTGGSSDTMQAGLMGDDLIAELIAEHSQPMPPDKTDPMDVRALEQYVGVPVHPAAFEKAGARLVGGRVLPVHTQRAAMLQYVIGNGQRVSVFIYDPTKIHVHAQQLAPRAVGTAEVRVGKARGYSVAVTQNAGVGYAFASDLDTDHSVQLAALADEP